MINRNVKIPVLAVPFSSCGFIVQRATSCKMAKYVIDFQQFSGNANVKRVKRLIPKQPY